jgi:hypothetical protein
MLAVSKLSAVAVCSNINCSRSRSSCQATAEHGTSNAAWRAAWSHDAAPQLCKCVAGGFNPTVHVQLCLHAGGRELCFTRLAGLQPCGY